MTPNSRVVPLISTAFPRFSKPIIGGAQLFSVTSQVWLRLGSKPTQTAKAFYLLMKLERTKLES